MKPESLSNWGRFTEFDIVLDGAATGAVFLGKKTKLQVNRKGNLLGPLTVEILHNGYPLTTLQGIANESLRYEFDAVPGLNRLSFTLKKNGRVEKQYVAFHANP
jgi:hypothetical protein